MRQLLIACLALLAAPYSAAQTRAPIVVELFTSQGCEACPQANLLLARLADESDVVALTYSVDIWDYLGWRDTFARPEFAERLRAYARAQDARSLHTPQMVLNGASAPPGARLRRINEALDALRAERDAAPDIHVRATRDGIRVAIGRGPAQSPAADVWLASYRPGAVYASIARGENAGRRIAHYNLVEGLERLGAWSGAPARFEHGPCAQACVLIVQGAFGGGVLAAARVPES